MSNQSPHGDIPTTALLKLAEVATALNIGKSAVYKLIDSGSLPSIKLPGSRSRRIRRSDLIKWIESLNM